MNQCEHGATPRRLVLETLGRGDEERRMCSLRAVKGAVTPAMFASMADNPVIFCDGNPDPKSPREAHESAPTRLSLTGPHVRLPNPRCNNVLAFPTVPGRLGYSCRAINDEMQTMRLRPRAGRSFGAREDVPDEWRSPYAQEPHLWSRLHYPTPFDPRLDPPLFRAVARADEYLGAARARISIWTPTS